MMEASQYGAFDPFRQQYDCHVHDFESLMKLSEGKPFSEWMANTTATTTTTTTTSKPISQRVDVNDVTTWFPNDIHRVAFYGVPGQEGLTYANLHRQVKACPTYLHHQQQHQEQRYVVAVVLPLSLRAELAVVLVALLAQPNVCVAPLDGHTAPAKLRQTMQQLGCDGIVATPDILQALEWETTLPDLKDVRAVESAHTQAGAVRWTVLRQQPPSAPSSSSSWEDPTTAITRQAAQRAKMLLRTSGTTAGPKVVALHATHLLHYGTCLALGLGLRPDDVACNAMPLFHIGGIASALLCVLVSGSAAIMMPGPFEPSSFLDRLDPASSPHEAVPTWYYAAPTMHKALILSARSRGMNRKNKNNDGQPQVPNKLRLIRSAAAHLPHETAVELAELFCTNVYPTYGMTESMPICVPDPPVRWDRPSPAVDTVGRPVGISLAIVDATGTAVPYGAVGEIAVKGPGALESYVNIPARQTHTPQGWLRTGDVGFLDEQGRLFIKGRSKEMIKRGGEQVWPNEVDAVVQAVPGVKTAVTFGVSNELWGEEVAVVVVLERNNRSHVEHMKSQILKACRDKLDDFAVPRQVIVVDSPDKLAKGATGKYMRTQMASHLGVTAKDTSAMRMWQSALELEPEEEEKAQRLPLVSSSPTKQSPNIKPSKALNGIRFVTACFVVHLHTGYLPNLAWTKIQSFTLNMQIFFFLIGFQTACNVKSEVLSSWSSFVGTKIGSMHALFVIAVLFAIPAWFMWECTETGFQIEWKERSCFEPTYVIERAAYFVLQLSTGMGTYRDNILRTVWFQTVAYQFLIIFPWFDKRVRQLNASAQLRLMFILAVLSVTLPWFVLGVLEAEDLHFTILTWWPHLGASVVLGNVYRRMRSEFLSAKDEEAIPYYKRPKFWGRVTDTMSVLFALCLVAVAVGPTCAGLEIETYNLMRPFDPIDDEEEIEMFYGEKTFWACDIRWEEYTDFVHDDEESWTSLGRLEGGLTDLFATTRVGTPLILLWLYSMAWGESLTARLMNSSVLQGLAPLSYSVYLLHIPIARYYWLATRGFESERWWGKDGDFPYPVTVGEIFIILGLSVLLGHTIDRKIIPTVMTYTVKLGVYVCHVISGFFCGDAAASETHKADSLSTNIEHKVYRLTKAISGAEVSPSTRLTELGLDSLGITAFLGNLCAAIPEAAGMTLPELLKLETVSDLVYYLEKRSGN